MIIFKDDIIFLRRSMALQTEYISGLSSQIKELENKIDGLENELRVYRKFIDTRISSLPEDRPEKFRE